MIRVALLIGLCASFALCHVRQARAGDDLAPEVRAARAHYHAGQAYFRQGELRRALAEFKAAARDDARPELDYNIGLAYDRLGDAARAVEAYRRFMTARPAAPERAEIEARNAALERAIGELVITSRVGGATITLDGELFDPLHLGQPMRVTEGPHEVLARKEPLLTQRRLVRAVARTRVVVEIGPREPDRGLDRRGKLGIGLGVGSAVIVITGVALGVYFGTRPLAPFDPGGAAGVVSVRPLALGGRP